MDIALRAEGLAKTYRGDGIEVLALRGVDLAVGVGEFVAIMGPSGCGKSTLLHLLGGLDRPTAGWIELGGERVEDLSETAWAIRRRADIGYVFQFFNLVANLTVAENVELPALLVGMPSADASARRDELLERLGIAARRASLPSRLSGGEQQRVALARALVNRPRIVLADEPTGNLDSDSSRAVLQLIRELHADGQAFVVVTHDARVASAADRVLQMRDGLIVDEVRLDRETSGSVASELLRLEV